MGKGVISAIVASFMGMNCVAVGPADRPALPDALASPDHGVVCNRGDGICYDRFGPSIGLTEIFLGKAAAEALTETLRASPGMHRPGAVFSPAEGVQCVRESGPCRVGETTHAALTAMLYEPRTPPRDFRAEARAIIGSDWRWLVTRYGNDTESRPADPGRYTLRLQPDEALRARVDCNQAGGRYRISGGAIVIEVTHSTMAACEPGSLERVFLRDLGAAAGYFMKEGRLYLDLKYDTGTMEFDRQQSRDGSR